MTVSFGSELAGYRIEDEIARGGMGVVYRATELALERPVALKLIAPELTRDPSFRERFLRESRLAASLDHPGILPVYAAGEVDGELYLATRYVEGTDLRSLLEREGLLAPARALDLVGQVADALDAAHARGLVHRDVKPGNVLVDVSGHCYLCDFGLTKRLDAGARSMTGPLAGTLDYLAPEQIRRGEVDGRTDQYALACVLYECLSGTPPFHRETEAQTLWAHMQDDPAPLREAPELDPVLERALAKDPNERYEVCNELVEDARARLGLGPSPVAVRRRRRHVGRKLLLAGAALMAAAVAAVVLVLVLGGESGIVAPPHSVAAIDPDTREVVAAIPMSDPITVAASEDWVWALRVTQGGSFTISRIEPRSKRVEREFSVTGTPTRLLAAAGALWVRTAQEQIVRVSASSDSETGRWTLPRGEAAREGDPREGDRSPFGGGDEGSLAYGENAVWAAGPWATSVPTNIPVHRRLSTISRIDLSSSRIASEASSTWGPLATGFGSIWRFGDTAGLYRLAPRTLEQQTRINARFDRRETDIVVGEGRVWIVSALDNRVWELDPARNGIEGVYDVAGRITAAAAGAGAAWIGTNDGHVVRIDPVTHETKRVRVGGAALGIAVGGGLVWVAVG